MTPARRATSGFAPSRRVFFAAMPAPALVPRFARLADVVAARTHGRATESASIHLTLAFLGDVPTARLPELEAIGAAAAAIPAFCVTFDAIGAFRGARVAWTAPSAPPSDLGALAITLRRALRAAGFRHDDGTFRPHVTLARKCAVALPTEAVAPVEWPLDALALVASTLTAGGARYAVVARWPLGTPAVTPPAPCS